MVMQHFLTQSPWMLLLIGSVFCITVGIDLYRGWKKGRKPTPGQKKHWWRDRHR